MIFGPLGSRCFSGFSRFFSGSSRFVLFLFFGLLTAPMTNSPERVRNTIRTVPGKKWATPPVWNHPDFAEGVAGTVSLPIFSRFFPFFFSVSSVFSLSFPSVFFPFHSLSFLSLFFWSSLFLFALRGIPCFSERFSLLIQGFQGFGGDKKDLVFVVVFLAIFPQTNKEMKDMVFLNKERGDTVRGTPFAKPPVQNPPPVV